MFFLPEFYELHIVPSQDNGKYVGYGWNQGDLLPISLFEKVENNVSWNDEGMEEFSRGWQSSDLNGDFIAAEVIL